MTQTAYGASAFDILVPEYTAMMTDTADATEYMGYLKGLELLKNANYTDINDDVNEASIVRMAALDIAKQYGDSKYYPNQAVTGYEALGFLVRMLGDENAVMTRVYAQAGSGTTAGQMQVLMNQEYLTQAQTRGIINQSEVIGLNASVNKELISVWTARAIGMVPDYVQNTVFSFTDWQSVNPTYRALIETMVTEGIIPVKNDGRFGPKNAVTRSEMAQISETALAEIYDTRNLESGFGIVIGVKPETIYEDGNTITRTTLTVKNTDGTASKLISEKHTNGNKNFNFVVYKNSYVSDVKAVALGDEIEYVIQDGEIKFVEVMDNNLILDKINANSLADEYSTFHYGTVSEIKSQDTYDGTKAMVTEIYRIVDVTGDAFDIIVKEDLYSGERQDIITYKEDDIGGVKLLNQGDTIEYLVNENDEVVYIKVAPINKEIYSGTIREITPVSDTELAKMTLYGYDDKVYEFPVATYANLMINDRYSDIDNFTYGMNATLTVANGYVIAASGESYSGTPGYIPEYGKMRMGTIVELYKTGFRIELTNGSYEFITTTSNTLYTKDGSAISFNAVKVGDSVKVYYSEIYTSDATKIEVEAPEVLFESIYKGKIKNVNKSRAEIQLIGADGVSKPQYIANNTWESYDTASVNLRIDENTEIYVGNQKLTVDQLEKNYTNYTAYAVVKSVYGTSKIAILSVKTGGETIYSSTIKDIDHTLGEFEIATKENFSLTEGTIIIKDGLIVPSSEVDDRDTVLVVSESPNGSYEQNALIVKVITPFDDIFDRIRIGTIETVNANSVTLNDYTSYTNNYLNDVTQSESGIYQFFTNSEIIDVTDDEDHIAYDAYEFYHGSFSKYDNVDKDYDEDVKGLRYKRYYAFMVVNESASSVISLHVRHKGLLSGQNLDDTLYEEDEIADELESVYDDAILSRGIVVNDDETWDRLEITDAHDYTEYTGQWTANKTNIYVQYTDAIFIENNQVKSIDDVEIGDYLYIMRIDEDALVVFID